MPTDPTTDSPRADGPAPALAPPTFGWRYVVQTVAALVVVYAAIAVAGAYFRPTLRSLGGWFVARFGYGGMAVGSFVSDAFMIPVPPQFYMLTSMTAGAPQGPSLVVICAGAVAGATTAYALATRLAGVGFIAARIERSRGRIDPLFARYGYAAVAVGAFAPVSYSLLCYLAGVYRVPYRYFALFALMRIPRLLVFYAFLRLGWGG